MRRYPPGLGPLLAALMIGLPPVASAEPYTVPPWPTDPRWQIRAESSLDFTRWRGVNTVQERADVQQRLVLNGWPMRQSDGRPRLSMHLDLNIGSDLGPEPDAFLSQPDPRRMRLDLFGAQLVLHDVGDRVDIKLGRQWFLDALGADALDGLVVQARLAPFMALEAGAGFAARRGWSNIGPDLFSPDGTRLQTNGGQVIRARLSTMGLRWLQASAGLTRQADTDVQVHRAAFAARVGPRALHVDTLGRYDLILRRTLRVQAAVGRQTRTYTIRAGWRRNRPSFSADSIWNAFVPVAHDAGFADVQARVGAWTLAADGAVHVYPSGDATAQTPGLPMPVQPDPVDAERALDVGGQLSRRTRWGRAGGSLRWADGFGGARQFGDLFVTVPMPTMLGRIQGQLNARVGGLRFEPTLDAEPVHSAWAMLTGRWYPEENMRIEAVAEWYDATDEPGRLRIMGRLALEDWW
jgi:hypothetical protein